MATVKKVHHVAVAVADPEAALKFWRDGLGLKPSHTENVPSQKAEIVFIPVGDSEIELVRPTEEGTGVAKFLQERGGGMHHLCLEVDDIDGMLAGLRLKGVRLINETAVEMEGRKMAFIHPKSTGGVLIELYELTG